MYLDVAKEEGCFLATTQGNISAIIQENQLEEIRHYSSGTVHASLFIQNLWMNLDGFLAKRRRISWWLLNRISAAIKRINPKRFRHLDGGLGLHQGFSCFSYK
jgi:hypothetical protein